MSPPATPSYNGTCEVRHGSFKVRTSDEAAGSFVRVPNGKQEPRWKAYEQKHGGRQTPMETTFEGRKIRVRLDKPPTDSQIVDYKDYNWSNPSYQERFVQERVAEGFEVQIAKYKTIRPNVHLQFSQEPPNWVIQAIQRAGGTYSVVP